MKNKLVAGFMAATMMLSVMSTGVFAKELNPDSETNKAGDTQVTATVEENENKAAYVIEIPDKVDFGKIQQPETEGNAYSTKDITVSCIQADNLAAGSGIAVLVKDATATQSTDPFCLTHNTHSDCVLNYEIMNNNDESIQNGTWYANGFLFNLFTGAGQEATDKLRLNRNQLYNKGVDPKVVGVEVISDAILGKGLKEAAAYTYENTEKVLKEVWPELVD